MIEINGLNVRFGKSYAVEDFDLTVPAGNTTVIIGESGSGKSVMLSAILRMLPREARVSGSVKIDGMELIGMSEREFKKIRGVKLAYIPQGSGNSLNPLLKTGFQIAEPIMEHQKMRKSEALKEATELMRRLNIGDDERVANSYPHTLSGGMKQRALIAMGVASGAPVILADEPTKGLDRERVAIIEELFTQLRGHTILCVSHDLRFAKKIADSVCVMYSAQKVEEADASDFFTKPRHPYSRMLLDALPENGMKIPSGFAAAHDEYEGCRFSARCPEYTSDCAVIPPKAELGKVRCWRYASAH